MVLHKYKTKQESGDSKNRDFHRVLEIPYLWSSGVYKWVGHLPSYCGVLYSAVLPHLGAPRPAFTSHDPESCSVRSPAFFCFLVPGEVDVLIGQVCRNISEMDLIVNGRGGGLRGATELPYVKKK